MGTSFVTADSEHGFWMRDQVLEIWLRLLALHIPEVSNADCADIQQLKKRIRDQWLLASIGVFSGCVPVQLHEFASTEEGRIIVKHAISSLRGALVAGPKNLEANILSLLNISGMQGSGGFAAHRLIEVADAFLQLLEGKIIDTATSVNFMPGCK